MAGRRQAIIWSNAGMLLIRPLETKWNCNLKSNICIQENALQNVVCETYLSHHLQEPSAWNAIHVADIFLTKAFRSLPTSWWIILEHPDECFFTGWQGLVHCHWRCDSHSSCCQKRPPNLPPKRMMNNISGGTVIGTSTIAVGKESWRAGLVDANGKNESGWPA